MAKLVSRFDALAGFDDLYTAERDDLRCCAIRLQSGNLCLFSPVQGLGKAAIDSLKALGEVKFLLAPNHYHNKGLVEYAEVYSEASICAPQGARSRLERITSLRFADLTALQRDLPRNMRFVTPAGLKTGEVWLTVTGERHRAWLVVDAFCGQRGSRAERAGEVDVLGTFPSYGVGDRTAYLRWLERRLKLDSPTVIIPCHGTVVFNPQLPDAIRRLVSGKL